MNPRRKTAAVRLGRQSEVVFVMAAAGSSCYTAQDSTRKDSFFDNRGWLKRLLAVPMEGSTRCTEALELEHFADEAADIDSLGTLAAVVGSAE